MLKNKFYLFLILLFYFSFTAMVLAADTTPPISTLTTNPSFPNGANSWFISYPEVTISSQDSESGISNIYWRINGGTWNNLSFNNGLNLIQNPSFENGYISNWSFVAPSFSVGYKSSLFKRTGLYGAGIISLSWWGDAYWQNTAYLEAVPLKTYTYRFYIRSVTSWLDNGFYEIVSVKNGVETVLVHVEDIDLKFNYKEISGTFVSTSDSGAYLYMRMGIKGIGHLSIDDAYISMAGENTQAQFNLNQEGINTVDFYAVDGAGNVETTKQSIIKVDTIEPSFSDFETFNEVSTQKFASRINVSDSTSKLEAVPQPIFNYAVDGFTNGYYDDYANCAGNFNSGSYLNLNINYSDGATSGQVSTPVIDYCDTNWINCKRINFYVRDQAGNIGTHEICINGPYIVTKNGDVYARLDIINMGIGTEDSVWGASVSGSNINDISSTSNIFVESYTAPYLNDLYARFFKIYENTATTITSLNNQNGVFILDSNYSLNSELSYNSTEQLVFIDGDLDINKNITSTDSFVTYLVNGNIYIANDVTNVDVTLISTNEIYTAQNANLASALTINGSLIGQNLNFTRNTDRTLGSSEIIQVNPSSFFKATYLVDKNLYWEQVVD